MAFGVAIIEGSSRARSRARIAALAALAATLTALLLAFAPAAHAQDVAPHVAIDTDTDVCAMCHRAHTSAQEASHTVAGSFELTGSALLVGSFTDEGDAGLCYVCHGVSALGAVTDIETSFLATSSHVLTPDTSEYGPTKKQCSTCHDSHGTDHDTDGEPFAALLRTTSTTNTDIIYNKGEVFCAACHVARPASSFDGLAVWDQTAHATGMASPASGTDITCSNCHDQHGSTNAPMIRETLVPPAAPTTYTVAANDRRLCFGCHVDASSTWVGQSRYQASSHAQSEATVAISGEWASAEIDRRVGECHACHAPMGRDDGAGGVVPKLAEKESSALCYTCHTASGTGVDIASLEFPDSSAGDAELVLTFDPQVLGGNYSRVAVYAAETTGTAPRPLAGPREYPVTGRAGETAVGDLDADGSAELVVADPGSNRLEVFVYDELQGLTSTAYTLGSGVVATYVTVADVFIDGTGRPEIAVVSRSATSPFASNLYVYRLVGSSLSLLAGPIGVGNDASGLASGDVTAGVAADLVVTSIAEDALRVFTDSVSSPGTLIAGGPYPTRRAPRGPSIGDAWDGASTVNEIVVANSGEVTGTVSVISGTGTVLGSYDATSTSASGAVAYDTLVADVLPNVSGAEIVVALRNESGTSAVNVFPQLSGGGLSAPQDYETGDRFRTSSLVAGDVDGDSNAELVVGNAGTWTRVATDKQAPSVQVFRSNGTGTALTSTPSETLWGGGTQLSGSAPGLAVVDLGGVGESRHPVGVVEDTHVSTEVATLTRHVECTDCHNVHEATSTPTVATGTPPAVLGALTGAWGVEVYNGPTPGTITFTERRGVLYEYEVCLKCHSQWSELEGSRDISSEVDTRNASFHAVEASSAVAQNTEGSFVTTTPAWTSESQVYCTHCHGNADDAEPAGPHTSAEAPIVNSPYWGVTPDLADLLCYDCHKYTVYYSGTEDGIAESTSNFYDGAATEPRLHRQHVFGGSTGLGYGCEACHVTHGGQVQHLIRADVGFTHSGSGGGTCDNACHSTGSPTATAHSYDGS